MNDPILLSVIIPAYNCEKYIEETALSVIMQPGRGLELLIIDDGSTDRTPDILQKLERYVRVRVIRTQNGGVSRARNLGIEEARGLYINFCDHDDIIARGVYTDEIADILESQKYDIVTFSDGFSDERIRWGKVVKRTPGVFEGDYRETHDKVRCSHQFSLWKRETLGDVRFPPDTKFNEDWNFVAMARGRSYRILAREELWYIWRMIPTSVSHNYSKDEKCDVHYWIDAYVYRMKHETDKEYILECARSLLSHSFKAIYYNVYYGMAIEEAYNRWWNDPYIRKAIALTGEEYMNNVDGWSMMQNDPKRFCRYVKKNEGRFQLMKTIALMPFVRAVNQRYRLGFRLDMRKHRPSRMNAEYNDVE